MKKIFVLCGAVSVLAVACRKESSTANVDVATQNSYDDQAIKTFLTSNYLDAKGNIKAYSSTDTTDDNYPNLTTYNPVTLPSGVVYIIIPNAQPAAGTGTAIGATDAISIMENTTTYQATKDSSGGVELNSGAAFVNTIAGTGIPVYDPSYYYVKNSVLNAYNTTNSTTKDHSFYEIEGLREGLSYFKAFNQPDATEYNLQGIIIVPSRDAFAQDTYYPYTSYSLNNRTFVFNFQIYRTTPRSVAGD